MTSAFSWQNSINLCPAYSVLQRQICLFSTFAFQSPIMKRTLFLGVLKGLIGLHRAIQLQLLQHYWSGIDLDYHDIERFALETN